MSVAELQQQENVRAWFEGAHHDELPEADQQRYLEALREELQTLRLRDPASFDIRHLEREVEIQVGVVSRMSGAA